MSDEITLGQQTLNDYLTVLASSQPAPGGGSGAAVAAAIGAALGEMVCNVTLARPSAPHSAEIVSLLPRLTRLRARFLALADDDERAFGQYRAATLLPKSTETEKQRRHAEVQDALLAAAAVPLALALACDELVQSLIEIARLGSRSVVSDAQTGAYLAAAAVQAAGLNLQANVSLLDDRAVATEFLSQFTKVAQDFPENVAAVDSAASIR